MAKYEIAQESNIDDIPYMPGSVFDDKDCKHIPAMHWKPLDDEAKAMCAKHNIKYTGEIPDSVEDLTRKLNSDMAAQKQRELTAGNPAAIGAAVVSALQDAGVIDTKKKAPARAEI